MPEETIISFNDITFCYPEREPLFDHFSFTLNQGEKVGMQGSIGSGKSTLLQMVVGLIHPQDGQLEVFGKPRRTEEAFQEVRKRVGFLFQDPEDQLFCPTVAEDIAFGPLNLGKRGQEVNDLVGEMLQLVGLDGFENRITHHLSGGEKRLVSLASVLAMKPEVLLLDEPDSNLDPTTADHLKKLLLNLPQSMIIVSHDPGFLYELMNRSVLLGTNRRM